MNTTKQRYYVVMETTATVKANSEEEAIQIAKKGEYTDGVELGYHIVDKVTKIRRQTNEYNKRSNKKATRDN